jgi:pyruvate, water dikinase
MAIKKEVQTKSKYLKWFSEIRKNSGAIAGGKGANLGEMYNTGIPVPPGFVVTAQAYDYFIEKAGLKKQIQETLDQIKYEDTAQLDTSTEKIRNLILASNLPKDMEEEIIEAYEDLDTGFDFKKGSALEILNHTSEPVFVAVRSSATAEDLADASFAGQQDSFLNVKGNKQLIEHIKKCIASLFTSRATYYRNKKGFEHSKVSLAVVVQKMVDSDKSGVIFSKDPAYKSEDITMEAVWGLGEGIVSGQITPDKYIINQELEITDTKISDKKIAITRDSGGEKAVIKLREDKSKHQVLKNYEIKKLSELALKLEKHYKKPQDIEFAIEREEIYIVQTRPITTIETRSESAQKGALQIKAEPILEGIAASPGIAAGKIKVVKHMADLPKVQEGDILVTEMTNPDMVVTMQKASAIVTDEGGLTSHAAIVSREMGIPAIVGTGEATTRLKEGEIITVDGYTGKVYKGKHAETEKKEVLPVTAETKTEIKVIVDLPSFAERAAKSGLTKVGLTRLEGIIAESGKHPEYFLKNNSIQEYEEIIFKGVNEIAQHFKEMWIRTSDIRSDEYSNLKGAPQEKEDNPMLGFHGIRYSLKKPEIFKAELRALKRIADSGRTIGILSPQVISIEELQAIKKTLEEIQAKNIKVGIMIETPASVQLIKDFCEDGIDFISFGTNDLTQYMLAIDRNNEELQDIYNEMHPAILYQLAFVIRTCKRYNVETSICGQAGSRKEMAKFLVENKIDSISVNADMAKEISEYIAQIEKERGEEPRQYNPEKKKENQDKKTKEENKPEFSKEDKEVKSLFENKKAEVLMTPQEHEQAKKEKHEQKVVERVIEQIEDTPENSSKQIQKETNPTEQEKSDDEPEFSNKGEVLDIF